MAGLDATFRRGRQEGRALSHPLLQEHGRLRLHGDRHGDDGPESCRDGGPGELLVAKPEPELPRAQDGPGQLGKELGGELRLPAVERRDGRSEVDGEQQQPTSGGRVRRHRLPHGIAEQRQLEHRRPAVRGQQEGWRRQPHRPAAVCRPQEEAPSSTHGSSRTIMAFLSAPGAAPARPRTDQG